MRDLLRPLTRLDWIETMLRKERALDAVERHASADFLTCATLALDACIARGDDFTVDEVWQALLAQPDCPIAHEKRAIAVVLRRAARDQRIQSTGTYRKSTQQANHQRPVQVWRVR